MTCTHAGSLRYIPIVTLKENARDASNGSWKFTCATPATRPGAVRGSRPGRGARRVIRGMFGARIASDVAQRLVDDSFPKAGWTFSSTSSVTGFSIYSNITIAATASTQNLAAGLNNNSTASLWILVRDGSATTASFICKSSGDTRDDLIRGGTVPAALNTTWDFKDPAATTGSTGNPLSYSFLNMYDRYNNKNWSANASSDWALMADNNDATKATLHDSYKGATVATPAHIKASENSHNHSAGEGQNIGFGDGHVKFSQDPFQGSDSDNVFAYNANASTASGAIPSNHEPTKINNRILPANVNTDCVLIAVTGGSSTNNRLYAK